MNSDRFFTCPTCTDPGTRSCRGCYGIKYCSKECQETDWEAHKLLCKSLQDFQSRPAENMVRAVLFPTQQAKPGFVWVPIRQSNLFHLPVRAQSRMVDPGFLEERVGISQPLKHTFETNAITGTSFAEDYLVELYYDRQHNDKALCESNSVNKAVMAATGRVNASAWRGPILAVRGRPAKERKASEPVSIEDADMDMLAYSLAVARMISFDNDSPTYRQMKGPKVEAVKVLCDGDLAKRGGYRFQAVSMPRRHPLMRCMHEPEFIPDIAKLIDLPLMTVKDNMRRTDPESDASNHLAAVMHIECNPREQFDPLTGKKGFGWPARLWDQACGNLLMARSDNAPLSVDVAEAYAAFCRHVITLLRRTTEDDVPGGRLARKEALARISPENWETFLDRWKEDRVGVVNDIQSASGGDADELIASLRGMKMERSKRPPFHAVAIPIEDEEGSEDISAGADIMEATLQGDNSRSEA